MEADHILIVNRIKEHTEYIGETESGILKMAVVGFGRQLGAESMHQLAVNITYHKAIHLFGASLFKNLKILGGIALLEDHFNRLRRVEAIRTGEIFSREPELLEESKLYKPTLPFEELDILVIDEIGKEISGAGMDTKVVGRIMNVYEKECETPRITRIVVRDLSEATDGNATGIGLADYTTVRAVAKTDFYATMTNCVTAVAPEKGACPWPLKRTGKLSMQPSKPLESGPRTGSGLHGFPIRRTSNGLPFPQRSLSHSKKTRVICLSCPTIRKGTCLNSKTFFKPVGRADRKVYSNCQKFCPIRGGLMSSFRRTPESSLFNPAARDWTPAFAGVTGRENVIIFGNCYKLKLRPWRAQTTNEFVEIPGTLVSKVSCSPLKGCLKEIDLA